MNRTSGRAFPLAFVGAVLIATVLPSPAGAATPTGRTNMDSGVLMYDTGLTHQELVAFGNIMAGVAMQYDPGDGLSDASPTAVMGRVLSWTAREPLNVELYLQLSSGARVEGSTVVTTLTSPMDEALTPSADLQEPISACMIVNGSGPLCTLPSAVA